MGRPVKKDVNGVAVFGTYTGAAGIRCEAYIGGSNQTDVFIVKQKGAKSYYVQDTSAGTKVAAKLVSGEPAAVGEMRLTGYILGGADASAVVIAKLMKRTAISFTGARYKWQMTNYADSTGDQIELIAL